MTLSSRQFKISFVGHIICTLHDSVYFEFAFCDVTFHKFRYYISLNRDGMWIIKLSPQNLRTHKHQCKCNSLIFVKFLHMCSIIWHHHSRGKSRGEPYWKRGSLWNYPTYQARYVYSANYCCYSYRQINHVHCPSNYSQIILVNSNVNLVLSD